jgi:hypothetical protein
MARSRDPRFATDDSGGQSIPAKNAAPGSFGFLLIF